MDTTKIQLSEELIEIIHTANLHAKELNLGIVSLLSVEYYLLKRYLVEKKGESDMLNSLFSKLGVRQTSDIISKAQQGLRDWELSAPKTDLDIDVDKIPFDSAMDRVMERIMSAKDIVDDMIDLPDGFAPEIDSRLFFFGALSEVGNPINEALSKYDIDSAHLLQLAMNKSIGKSIDPNNIPEPREDKKEEDKEESDFENAGKREKPISTRRVKKDTKTPTIDEFSVDMTALAEEGRYDPVIGRDKEISQVIEILSCRKKCNAILLGEAGVGKSALVEGLSQKIVSGDVPRDLKNKRIISVSTTDLTAGTQYRGQLEERVMNLCEELKENNEFILYLDEFHSATSDNSTSIADMLKPSLSRGEITVIASTTLDEYKKFIEKDGALKRRFQKVFISEPNVEDTYKILKGLAKKYQDFHHVRYPDASLRACAEYSTRYMYDRKSPDRAIDIMDTAGALTKLAVLSGGDEIDKLEKELSQAIMKKVKAIEKSDFDMAKVQKEEETKLEAEISKLRKEEESSDPKTWPEVTIENVATVISKICGVSVDKIVSPELDKIREMKNDLKKVVIGQDEAIESVVKSLSKSFLGLRNENRPVASFLFTGPSGVGKTLIAEKIAETVFGSKDAMLRIDGGELSQEGSVTKLIGASASFVGYNDSALLEKVRDRPQQLVLVDECEKIHKSITDSLFLNMLDTGMTKLSNGKDVSFRDAIIIFTSNEGTKDLELKGNGIGFGDLDKIAKRSVDKATVMKALEKRFRPEFRGRLTGITVFNSLGEPEMMKIFDLELAKFKERLKKKGYSLTVGKELKKYIVSKTDTRYGARDLTKGIGTYIEDKIVEKLLDPATDLTKKKIKANLVGEEVEITFE